MPQQVERFLLSLRTWVQPQHLYGEKREQNLVSSPLISAVHMSHPPRDTKCTGTSVYVNNKNIFTKFENVYTRYLALKFKWLLEKTKQNTFSETWVFLGYLIPGLLETSVSCVWLFLWSFRMMVNFGCQFLPQTEKCNFSCVMVISL